MYLKRSLPLLIQILLFSSYDVKTFKVEMDAYLHGFGGYFECQLYKDVMISINPATHSPGKETQFLQTHKSHVFTHAHYYHNLKTYIFTLLIFS